MKKNFLPPIILFSCIIIFFLLSSQIAYSQTEDFLAYSTNPEINICECTTAQDIVYIQNTNPKTKTLTSLEIDESGQKRITRIQQLPSAYSITYSGTAASLVSSTSETIVLAPFEEKDITHFFRAPCEAGEYDLTTTITADSGVAKALKQNINVIKCTNAGVTIEKKRAETCPCENAEFEIIITNTGSFTEVYTLSLKTAGGKAGFSENPITLKPQESKTIKVVVNTDCSISGNYRYTLLITTSKTQLEGKLELEHIINPCYESELKSGMLESVIGADNATENITFREHKPEYIMCTREEKTLPIMIKNLAEIENTYELEFSLPEFSSLHQKKSFFASLFGKEDIFTTTLKKGEISGIKIDLRPGEEDYGEYPLTINSKTKIGDKKNDLDLSITVENCFRPIIEIPERISLNFSQNRFPVSIRNTGKFGTRYTISIEGIEWLSPENPEIEIGSEQTGIVNIISTPSEDIKKGKYFFKVKATPENGVEYSQQGMLKLTKKGMLSFLLKYKWYLIGSLAILLVILFVLSTLQKRKEKKEEISLKSEVKKEAKKKVKKEAKKESELPKEEVKDDNKRKKQLLTLYIVIGALALIGIVLLLRFFGIKALLSILLAFLKLYWGYIAAGILLLIVLIIIIKKKEKGIAGEEEKPKPELKSSIKGEIQKKAVDEKQEKEKTTEQKKKEKEEEKKRKEQLKQEEKRRKEQEKKKAEKEKKKQAKEKYKKTEKYQKKIEKSLYVILGAIFLILIASTFIYGGFKGFISLPAEINASKEVVDTGLEEGYTTDIILSSIEDGRYVYDESGRVLDSQTKRKIPSYEYLKILRENKEDIIEKTILREEGYNLLIKTLDEEYKRKNKALLEAGCDITMEEEGEKTVNLSKIQDPDKDILTFTSESSINIDVDIEPDAAYIRPRKDFSGVENITITADDGKGGIIETQLTICIEDTGEELQSIKENTLSLLKKLKRARKYVSYTIGGLAGLVIIGLLIRFSKQIMDFLTEEEEKPKKEKKKRKKKSKKK